jgi:hypothetical protein
MLSEFRLVTIFASKLMGGEGVRAFSLLGVTCLRGTKAQESIGVSLSLTAL